MVTPSQLLAVVGASVLPLYGIIVGFAWKLGLLRKTPQNVSENADDIESNEADIVSLRADLRDVQRNMEHLIEKIDRIDDGQKAVHDLLADENHCGAPTCPWCDHESE